MRPPRSARGAAGAAVAAEAAAWLSKAGVWAPSSDSGTSTMAVSPPPPWGLSWTRMPCRCASLATTNRPMRRETDTSTVGASVRRSLAWASSSWVMPMPESVMESMTPPPSIRLPETVTRVSRGENDRAFSTSSAIRWMTSLTA